MLRYKRLAFNTVFVYDRFRSFGAASNGFDPFLKRQVNERCYATGFVVQRVKDPPAALISLLYAWLKRDNNLFLCRKVTLLS